MEAREIDYVPYIYNIKHLCKSENKSVSEFIHAIMQDVLGVNSLHENLVSLGYSKDNSVYKNLASFYQD
ncbi:MAG: hypothetical protein ACOZCL_05980 [Bacillota bacterium]